jgi:hypothetical protein
VEPLRHEAGHPGGDRRHDLLPGRTLDDTDPNHAHHPTHAALRLDEPDGLRRWRRAWPRWWWRRKHRDADDTDDPGPVDLA